MASLLTGSGSGVGDGFGSGYGYGSGSGSGYGYGDGFGDGDRDGSGYGAGSEEARPSVAGYACAVFAPWDLLRIGCEIHGRAWWREHWTEVASQYGVAVTEETSRLAAELFG